MHRPFNKKIFYKDSLLRIYRQPSWKTEVHTVQKFAELYTVRFSTLNSF